MNISFMARRLRRTYRRRRRYRPRRRFRRGRFRAAATQRQTSRFVVKSMNPGVIQIAPSGFLGGGENAQVAPNFAGTACISAYQNLLTSNYFQSLAKMYDQFKLDSFKVKITPTQSVLLQGQKQAVFVSAWDRNGVTNHQSIPSFNEIASYGSSFQRTVNLDATSWTATRKIFASTIMEKSSYMPTSVPGDNNITNLGNAQDYRFPWNPQLLIGILCTVGVPTTQSVNQPLGQVTFSGTQSWSFMCEFTWHLTFRGLRYDAPSSAPMVNARMVTNTTAAVGLGRYSVQPTIDQTQLPQQAMSIITQTPGSLGPISGTGRNLVFRPFSIVVDSFFQFTPVFIQDKVLGVGGTKTINNYSDNITVGKVEEYGEYCAAVYIGVGFATIPSQTSVSVVIYPNRQVEYTTKATTIFSIPSIPLKWCFSRIGQILLGTGALDASPSNPFTLNIPYFLDGKSFTASVNINNFAQATGPIVEQILLAQANVNNVQYSYDSGQTSQIIDIFPTI